MVHMYFFAAVQQQLFLEIVSSPVKHDFISLTLMSFCLKLSTLFYWTAPFNLLRISVIIKGLLLAILCFLYPIFCLT